MKRYFLVEFAIFLRSTLQKTHPEMCFENFYHCRSLTFLNRTSSRVSSCSESEISLSDGNTRKMCEICSKLTIKTPKWRQWPRSGVFIVNFEQIFLIWTFFLIWYYHFHDHTDDLIKRPSAYHFRHAAGSRTAATPKMELFQPLTIITVFHLEYCSSPTSTSAPSANIYFYKN